MSSAPISDRESDPLPSQPDELRPGRVLVADDSPAMREMIATILRDNAFEPLLAEDGAQALDMLKSQSIDVVLSDIRMPKMDGIALLEAVKGYDADIPVLLLTGVPELSTAIKAVELGAFRYLTKPVTIADLAQAVARALQLCRLARAKRQAASLYLREQDDDARRRLGVDLDESLRALTMAYQPLVDVERKHILGYEALLRCSGALPGPTEILDAAERLDRMAEVGRCVRRAVVRSLSMAPPWPSSPSSAAGWWLFINLHPLELLDSDLLDPLSPLAEHARHVVLEVTERSHLDRVDRLAHRIAELRKLGYRVAVDDLGAGYASLESFAQLQPDFVKLDMSLVQNAPGDAVRRRLIRSMIQVCDELGIEVVGEGVETIEQRDTLSRLGCRIMQGYLFARPQPSSFPAVSW
jgi:EAL domain-containing protein (putative c-di-GMP-specific phosphodiesterase class I)